MAYLETDDKQRKDGEEEAGGAGGGGASLGSSGEAATSAGTGSSASPAGAGGQSLGGFTNIQSYLTANSGNTGAADKLSKQVESSFDSDKQSIGTSAGLVKSQAQDQVKNSYLGQDAASKMIQQSGSLYGTGDELYNQNKSKLQGALNAQYSGPSSYSAGLSADSQRYGTDLGNDQGFKGMVTDMYQKSSQGADGSGRALGSGGLALQEQIDSGTNALGDARSKLMNEYAGLTPYLNEQVTGANDAITTAKGDIETNKSKLSGFLKEQAMAEQGAIDQRAADQSRQLQEIAQKRIASATSVPYSVVNPSGASSGWYSDNIDAPTNFRNPKSLRDYIEAVIPTINASNASGVKDNVGRFNSIMDALGIGSAPIVNNASQMVPKYRFNNGQYFQDSDLDSHGLGYTDIDMDALGGGAPAGLVSASPRGAIKGRVR